MPWTEGQIRADYVNHWGSDDSIAQAARVSTKGIDGNDAGKTSGLVKRLWKDGHVSCFEHCGMTFQISCPIPMAAQIMRHRSWSFNSVSGRYTELKPVFHIPSLGDPIVESGSKPMDYGRKPASLDQYTRFVGDLADVYGYAWEKYEAAIRSGISREEARFLLPQGIFTEFWATGNLRSIFHFLDQRLDPHAQFETRIVASDIEWEVSKHFPIAHRAWAEAKEE
nr:FAD-dependent thymidylate synthase [Brevibacterium sp. 68QC2CO]